MSTPRIALTSATSGALVVLAATGVVWSFRISAAVLVTALVAAGQRWDLPTATGAGLLGLVVVVGAGPASAAGPLGLAAWALPTWAVVLMAADSRPPPTRPRDPRTRLRLGAGEATAVVVALPLVVLAASGGRPAAIWAAGGAVAVAGLLLVATTRVSADRPGR